MKFAAMIEYIQEKAKIGAIRPTHRLYLAKLKEQNELVACGPFTDDWGALIVYEAPTKEDAEKLVQGDPFNQNGVFIRWTIRPWNIVMANKDLLPS